MIGRRSRRRGEGGHGASSTVGVPALASVNGSVVGLVRGGDVHLTRSGAGFVAADGDVSIRFGGSGPVLAKGNVSLEMGGVQTVLATGRVTVGRGATVGIIVSPRVTLEEGARVLTNSVLALSFGAGAGVLAGLLVGRRRR